MLIKSLFTKLGKYKHMLQINAEIHFKSIHEKYALFKFPQPDMK